MIITEVIPLGAFASRSYSGNGEWVVLSLHIYQVVNGLLAGENILICQSLFYYQVSQRNHLIEQKRHRRVLKGGVGQLEKDKSLVEIRKNTDNQED